MRSDAFTFVEVLISLAVSTILVGTVCSALIHVTRVERQSEVLRETPFLLQTLACRTYLATGPATDAALDLPPGWSARPEELDTDDGEAKTAWLTWQLAPADDPSFGYALSLRDGLGPW